MSRNLTAVVIAVGAFSLWTGSVTSSEISVPNASFESPPTNFVSIGIDAWQKSPKPDSYDESTGGPWDEKTGVFKNPAAGRSDHIDNCDGSQAAWLFAVPEVGLLQDYDSIGGTNSVPNHEFDARYQVGASYSLTVAVLGGGGGMPEGATLEISLYYRDDATNRVAIAATSITNYLQDFPVHTHLVDYSVKLPTVQSSDAWAGRHIGVQLFSTVTTNLQGGYWDLDNVRLEEIPPPVFTLNATATAGELRVSWPSIAGYQYQVKNSADLMSWSDVGTPLSGTGSELSKQVQISGSPTSYFKVLATEVP